MKTKMIISAIMGLVLTACATDSANEAKSLVNSQAKIYTYESDANGFNTKTHFYDNGEEVVVFDTQFTPELAESALSFIQSKTNHPITHVVITHPNPDKFNGMKVFQDIGARVTSSKATLDSIEGVHNYKKYFFVNIAKMFTEEQYPKLSKVDRTFTGNSDLVLKNGEKIQLSELSEPGVSSTQTVAYIPTVNALVVGDLVHHKAHAWLEGGIVGGQATPTIDGWISDLGELKEKFISSNPIVLGGRGENAKLDVAVDAQVDYLQKARRLVQSYVEEVGDASQFQGELAGKQHSILKDRFSVMFPDYKLNYMIEYGVYGLVQQTL